MSESKRPLPILYLIFASTVLALIFGATFVRYFKLKKETKPLPVYGQVGDWSFTERSGNPHGSVDLKGKVWIAGFIFTHCGGPCPEVTAAMAGLQADPTLRDVRLVSFTVDPERDDPKTLSIYADNYKADKDRWWFFTAKPDEILPFIRKRFMLPVEKSEEAAKTAGMEIAHSTRLGLVDAAGQIRGFYRIHEAESMQSLRRDAARMLREAFRAEKERQAQGS